MKLIKGLAALAGSFGILVWAAFFIGLFLLGPHCFAYDLNHLIPLVTHKPLGVSMWHPVIFIAGVFFSETAVPVAVILWVLVTIGLIA